MNQAPPDVGVLLVDDRAENLLALEAVLADLNQPLVRAASGAQALRRVLEQDFAVILLDVQMPGLDGLETARLIRERERSRHTPIIFLTSDTPSGASIREAYELGAVDFVVKPIVPEVLRGKVSTLVKLAHASAEVRRLNAELEGRVRERTAAFQTASNLHHDAEERLLILADASDVLLSKLDPHAVVTEILHLARRLLPAHAYAVWRITPDGSGWEAVADLNLDPDYPRTIPASSAQTLLQPIFVEDVTTEPRLTGRQDAYRMEHVRSLLCVPLIVNGENTGTIAVYYVQPHHFSDAEMRVARALASLAATALGTAELYAEQSRMRKVAEDAQRRLSFLADSSRILAASLEIDTTLERLAQLLVPRLADWCVVSMLEPNGTVRPLSVAHVDPDKVSRALEAIRRYPVDPSAGTGIMKVLRTGVSELHPHISDEQLTRVAQDEEHLQLLRSVGFSSLMRVPLVARGQVLGAITFVAAESGVHYTDEDLALAEDLADRAAAAIDNARLYQEARQADESVRYVMEHAHCLLWHAYVDEPEAPDPRYRWDLRVFDEEAAQRFLPLELTAGETYAFALHRSRWPEDAKRVDGNARAALDGGLAGYQQEYRCVRRDGQVRWLAEQTRLELIRPGRWRAVGVCTDITERKETEEALRKHADELGEADRRKDQFLRMLAHELRNPLGVVSNALHVIATTPPESPAYQRAVATARRHVEHQTHLINDLLDVSRITRGRLKLQTEELDLARLAADAVEDYRPVLEAAGVLALVILPDRPVPVLGDRTRLAQVLGNLLDNSAKFTSPGGIVEVRLDYQGDRAELTVRDTGMGIEPELLPQVFDTFMQADRSLDRSRGGLGLGLSIVKGLVELHGGHVSGASEGPGRGAAFTVQLPMANPRSQVPGPTSKDAGSVTLDLRHETSDLGPGILDPRLPILVVEDNRDAAETLRDLLELAGYHVHLAFTGPEGLQRAQELRPRVILCDIGLPGMDGYEVARRIRDDASIQRARLIAVTGYGGDQDQQRSREAGFDHHLTKPVDPDVLLELLVPQGTACGVEN